MTRRKISLAIFLACGAWLIGLGVYFMALRPALLPEDERYIGRSLAAISSTAPGVEAWLGHVFRVMGGFMVGSGVLTAFLAVSSLRIRQRGTAAALLIAGLATVATMSWTNFALDSDFKWLLAAPPLLWLVGIGLYLADSAPVNRGA